MSVRILAALLIATASGASAQIASGDTFVSTGPRPFPSGELWVTPEAAWYDSTAARQEEWTAARRAGNPAYGGSFALVGMDAGRAGEGGTDILTLWRDGEGRVRGAEYLTNAVDSLLHRAPSVEVSHWFDGNGRTASIIVQSLTRPLAGCGEERWHQRSTLASVGAEGRLLSSFVLFRPLSLADRMEDGTLPDGCAPLAPEALPVLAYPSAASLLEGLGVPPLDSLRWTGREDAPPLPPPPGN